MSYFLQVCEENMHILPLEWQIDEVVLTKAHIQMCQQCKLLIIQENLLVCSLIPC